MKRFLPLIPVLVFLYTSSCDSGMVSIAEGTAVGQTQTAAIWTATPTSPPDPDEPEIVEWLNETMLMPAVHLDELERTVDAKYQVVEVQFPQKQNSMSMDFRVDIRCECAFNTQCCIPERMFVRVIEAMEKYPQKIIDQVSDRAIDLQVVCFDHVKPIGTMIAPWQTVKAYLLSRVTGYQLGAHVTPIH